MAETVPIQQLFSEMSIGDDPFDGMRLADAFFDRRIGEWRRSECGITDRDYTLFMARVPRIRLLKQAIPPSVWDEVTAKATGTGETQRQRMDSMAGALADCLIHEDVSEELACCIPVDRTFGESADIAAMDDAVAEICKQLSLVSTPPNLVLLPGERLLTVIGVYYDPNDGGRFFAVTTLGRLYYRYNGMVGAPRFDLTDAHKDLIERIGNMIMESLGRGEDAGERMQLVAEFIAALK